ncbi:MAG TPA: endonuclease/exonuclease/phosphatase family protein [Candidatus Limnocylindria bacterium]|nr:endonuclease/exonuclease/phosphatase family protein [Candidatus Limnocylindria bacterium]
MPQLTVLTWNLQGRAPPRLGLAEALRAWQPDVLLLQEAHGDRVGEILPPSFQSRLWWPTAGTRPGIVIASHLALEEQGILEPVDPPWDRPRVAWARFRLGAAALTVASVHLLAPLRLGARARRDAQLDELAAWAEAWVAGRERLVVAGDFNTRDPRLPRMVDACGDTPLPTWRPLAVPWMRPMLRLDAIFLAPGLRALDAGIGDRRGSDHLPVIARIEDDAGH